MNIQLVSDLHLDHFPLWYKDLTRDVIAYKENVDALLVVGDTAEVRDPVWLDGYKFLADHYPNVIGVLGNHEHYGTTEKQIGKTISKLPENVKILRRESIKIQGVRFIGTTMWFPKTYSKRDKEGFSDFQEIPGGEKWILEQNDLDVAFLNEHVKNADVVLTHHLPSYLSVDKRFINSSTNAFFICNMESLIERDQPKYWFHGHKHRGNSYWLKNTRVVCAPRGYRGDVQHYKPVVVYEL